MMARVRQRASKKQKRLVCIILGVIFLIIICFTGYLIASAPLETKILQTKFLAGETTGFDLNKTALTFGKIIPGNSAIRSINLANQHNFSIEVKAYVSKSLADYLVIKEEDLHLKAFENKSIPVTVSIPANMTLGEYSGKIVLKIYKE